MRISASRELTGSKGSRRQGVGAVALAVSLIGTAGTASELGPDSLSASATGSWRCVIGAVGLLAVSAVRGHAPWRYSMRTRWLVLGGSGIALCQLAFFEAVSRTGVAVGTLVTIGVGPLAAGVIDWWAYRRYPERRWLAGVALALTGVVLLSGGAAEVVWSGIAFGVLAGCAIPCQAFAAQRLMADRPLLTTMATMTSAGALLLLPAALGSAGAAFSTAAAASTVAYLGLVTMALAFALWGFGLKHVSLSVAAMVGLLEPAVAATLATTVLREPLTPILVAGICLVITGVAATSLNHGQPNSSPLSRRRGR